MREAPQIIYTVILATIFFVVLVVIIMTSLWRYHSRKRAHEMAEMQFNHALMQARLEIQEQTFKSISQELHDNLGQLLTLAKLNMTMADIDGHPQVAKEKMNEAIDLVSESIQTIRDLSRTMHSESVNRVGLIAALETEIRMIEKLGLMQPVFQVTGVPVDMEDKKALIIFRIVQEALHNVVKHSKCTLVELKVHFEKEQAIVTICDNGSGFNGHAPKEGGGLRNMRDRSKIIGATFQMESEEGKGTCITLTIPDDEL
jgi:two-component system NarL family sensor kinase